MKTFKYRQSKLPPMPPGLEVAVAELDTQIAGLVCENIGNHLALQKISEMLSDCTDTCELNLQQIEVVADGQTVQPTLKDLPIEQKQLVYSCSYTNSVLLNLLSELTGRSAESLATEIAAQSLIYSRQPTIAAVETFIDNLMEASKSDSTWYFKRM